MNDKFVIKLISLFILVISFEAFGSGAAKRWPTIVTTAVPRSGWTGPANIASSTNTYSGTPINAIAVTRNTNPNGYMQLPPPTPRIVATTVNQAAVPATNIAGVNASSGSQLGTVVVPVPGAGSSSLTGTSSSSSSLQTAMVVPVPGAGSSSLTGVNTGVGSPSSTVVPKTQVQVYPQLAIPGGGPAVYSSRTGVAGVGPQNGLVGDGNFVPQSYNEPEYAFNSPIPQKAISNTLFQQLEAPINRTFDIDYLTMINYQTSNDPNITLNQGISNQGVIWAKGLGLFSTYKAKNGINGYKADQAGIMIGCDGKLENGLIVGVAYTGINSIIKFKNYIEGNSTEFYTNMATIYGKYNFDSGMFINGEVKYGFANIDTNNSYGNSTLYGDGTAHAFGSYLELGRSINMYPVIFTPKLGISYSHVRIPGFKEEGIGYTSTISSRTGTKAKIIPQIALGSVMYSGEYFTIIPEVHFNINYAFHTKNKLPAINTIRDGEKLVTPHPREKKEKNAYVVGGSVNLIQQKKVEFAVNYDYIFAPHLYITHSVAAKLRVNF